MKTVNELKDGWLVQQLSENGRIDPLKTEMPDPLPATMPMQAHDVLMAAGKLTDPMTAGECPNTQWVGECDWLYKKVFSRPEAEGRTYLRFRGLDTFVDIYLNGEHLAFHDDCYLPLRIDVTEHVREENTLLLHFYAAMPYMKTAPEFEEERNHPKQSALIRAPRKPAEDFNFFNGAKPAFISIGPYDLIELEVIDECEMLETDIQSALEPGYEKAAVFVSALTDVDKGEISCVLKDPSGRVAAEKTAPVRDAVAECSLEIDDPELWYPLGYGDHPLYELEIDLILEGEVRDIFAGKIGFREIRRIGDLEFEVNGMPVKMWGANFTPMPRAGHVWDRDKCTKIMNWVENCRMPSIRAWGPAQPVNEQLYDEADERGILVWAEFAHTGGPFPDTDEFRAKCCAEAENWIKTLKHHASLFMWCGGNETYLGIDVDAPDEEESYTRLFEKDYKEVCERLDPDRYYHVNSPYGGDTFHNCADIGDTHNRNYGFYLPDADFPRFPTENIRITIPLRASLEKYLGKDLWWPEGGFTGARTEFNDPGIPPAWAELLCPDMHWINFRIGYVEKFFDADGSPDSLLFRLGAGTARFIRETIERYRRGKPPHDPEGPRRTVGHYWWKLNDTFPMLYASLIDNQLQPNMAYYAMKHALSPLMVSIDVAEKIYVWVVNDTGGDVDATLTVRELDQDGLEVQNELSVPIKAARGDSVLATDCAEFGMFYNKNPLTAELRDASGSLLASTLEYACPDRHNWFPESTLNARREGDEIVLSSDKVVRWVEIYGSLGWGFEDNFFDLLPNVEKRVKILYAGEGTLRIRAMNAPQIEI